MVPSVGMMIESIAGVQVQTAVAAQLAELTTVTAAHLDLLPR